MHIELKVGRKSEDRSVLSSGVDAYAGPPLDLLPHQRTSDERLWHESIVTPAAEPLENT